MNRSFRTLAAPLAVVAAALLLTACTSQSADYIGTWGDESQDSTPSLVLNEDGTVSGTDGCNRILGEYSYENETVVFGNLATTMRFCEGVDTWLNLGSTATVSGDEILVFDADGKELGSLERHTS